MKLHYKRFGRPAGLKSIGRELLGRFFDSFKTELNLSGISLPSNNADDDVYFGSMVRLLAAPEGLPEGLNEVLFAIDELSSADGQERLEEAIACSGVALEFLPGSSRADLAVQVWLAAPDLLARVHNCHRLRRLSAFAHFGAEAGLSEKSPFQAPDSASLSELTEALDPWFARHQRGHNTTRIECHLIEGDYWFLVRHGETFSRTPRVEEQKTRILHYRPERDDVVVYAPEQDELRINTRTKGERDLYAREFGYFLRGTREYFSRRAIYTLEPLRSYGPEALDPLGVDGIEKITLREVEIAWDERGREVMTRQADDLFEGNQDGNLSGQSIPDGGRLARAVFDFQFSGRTRPTPIQISLPNMLKLGRHCDLRAVNSWLTSRGFRLESPHYETLVCA